MPTALGSVSIEASGWHVLRSNSSRRFHTLPCLLR
jgi:hypothetical protein